MNTPVPAGLSSYPTVSGQRYRIYGLARSVPSDQDVQNALIAAGLLNLTYTTNPAALPSDWPSYTPVTPSSDERAFFADGTWSVSGTLPTSIAVGSGAIIFYYVWAYTPDTGAAVTTGSTETYILAGVGGLVLGFVGALLLLPKHKSNPLRYSTSFTYRGVTVHVHESDYGNGITYCADYKSIEQMVPGAGGQVCTAKQSSAISTAKKRIDAILVGYERQTVAKPKYPPAHQTGPILSPWD